MKRKGIFFSIDALIALAIIVLTMALAYPLLNEPKPDKELQSDILETLSALEIGETTTPYAQALVAQGTVEPNKSVLEAIGDLYVSNLSQAQLIAQEMLDSVTTKENIGIWYGNTLLASHNSSAYESAEKVETSRQTISGIQEGASVTGFSARAFLQSKRQTKYTYIGGYVGEGNITIPLTFTGTPISASLEAATGNGFDLYINNNYAGSYSPSPSLTEPSNYTIPVAYLINGTNTIQLRKSNLSLAGGFLKLVYESSLEYEQPVRYYFPGIKGIINLYDGFYVPGTLQQLSLSLHYDSPFKAFLTIGNKTVVNQSTNGPTTITLADSELRTLLNYNALSNSSIPLRLGLENISLVGSGVQDIDVVLITDVSGSMDWRLNSDTTGTARNCTNPLLNDSTTKRISLAKCLDKSFVGTILNSSSTSRIALVSFSNDANTYVNFTRNQTLLDNAIEAYTPNGATCVSCALNRAYKVLEEQSDDTRVKFVVTMTDGVTNRRSTLTCTNLYGVGTLNETRPQAVGESGIILSKNITTAEWVGIKTSTSSTLNDVDFFNATYGLAVGASGSVIRWNGTEWSNLTSPVATTLNGLDLFNATYGLAVGASGRVLRWNGTGWSSYATISNSPTLYGVSIYNNTLAFATGTRSSTGRIYKSTNGGQTWSEDHASGSEYRSVVVINKTRAFAVGNGGRIQQWSGSSWSQVSSGLTDSFYGVSAFDNMTAFTVGGNNGRSAATRYNGGSWSSSLSAQGDSLRGVQTHANKTYAVGEGGVVYERDATTWQQLFTIPPVYEGNLTEGISCTADQDSCDEINSFPALNANYSACRVHQELNATIYSIGFGPIETCDFANVVLQSIASCGNGTFYASSNAGQLQEFYHSIAQSIIQLAYNEQTAQTIGNISTELYSDSYLEFNYTKKQPSYGLLITYEKQFDNTTSVSFTLPSNVTLMDVKVLSYSGARWTARTTINNKTTYQLSSYGNDYTKQGDPFEIHIPVEDVGLQNNITVLTGISPTNMTQGSGFNKLIYTVLKNATGYSPIVSLSEGCLWTIGFQDNTNITVAIPSNYTGSNLCSYLASSVVYDPNDATQESVYRLLRSLDLDNDNKVDVTFTPSDINIALTQVTGIPFTWSTEVQVRIWR